METDSWKLIETVTVSYEEYVDFDIKEIISEYNANNNTNYKLEDVDDLYVKRNTLYLEMKDETVISEDWILWDWDYKRPDKYLYNQF